jgi:hypothetical protein
MAVKFNHQSVLDSFKKKIAFLKAKERQHHEQLNTALNGARHLGQQFKSELKSKLHQLDIKIDAAQAANYIETFIDLERQMVRDVATKARAFAKALAEIDKQMAKHQHEKPAKSTKRKAIAKKSNKRKPSKK